MTIPTITRPSADERLRIVYGKRLKKTVQEDLIPEAKYAVCILRLAPAVEKSDYPALKASVEAIAGIQDISLLTDYTAAAVADIPAGDNERLRLEANVGLVTPEVPE